MNKQTLIIIMTVISVVLVTGCWDKVEIENRLFVLGAAADVGLKNNTEEFVDKNNQNLYTLTLEMPRFTKMGDNGSGEASSQANNSRLVLTASGTSFVQIMHKMASESNKKFFLGQQQVLIIGKELARQYDLKMVSDFWGRDSEIKRSVKVLLAQGKASDIFDSRPKMGQTVSMFIKEQLEQQVKTSKLFDMNLLMFDRKLAEGADFLVGRITMSGNRGLKIAGSGIIKAGKLKGWLSDEETNSVQFVTGEIEGGELVVQDPEYEGAYFTLEIDKVKTQLKADITDDIPSFSLDVQMKCHVASIDNEPDVLDQSTIARVERSASDTLEQQIKHTVVKLQKQYNADVFGFGTNLEKYHNEEWKTIKPEWDKLYPDIPVAVTVTTRIDKLGLKF